jgi:tripartite motif-containing protein 71
MGLAIGIDSSLYVSDYGNNRVMQLRDDSTMGTMVAGSVTSGSDDNQLQGQTSIHVDAMSNIYVGDSWNYRVMFWRNGSSNGIRVAGSGTGGCTRSEIDEILGLTVDSYGNIYVAEKWSHRVTKWAPNATIGTLVAGEDCIQGSNSNQLNTPGGLYLDELLSHLYIANSNNNRIQRITLGGSTNAITLAGGNGAGLNNDQLNYPAGVYFSKNTDAIYIADKYNNRVTRWYIGATTGVTIAGIDGYSGVSPMLFYGPTDVTLSLNETFLYVSDNGNNRVQRFELI